MASTSRIASEKNQAGLGHRLAMLSEEQIRDGFRAAGYTPEEIEVYTLAMRKRIEELGAL